MSHTIGNSFVLTEAVVLVWILALTAMWAHKVWARRKASAWQVRVSTVMSASSMAGGEESSHATGGASLSDVVARGGSPFAELPPEIHEEILQYVDAMTLARCGRVCRAWRAIVGDDIFWRRVWVAQMEPRMPLIAEMREDLTRQISEQVEVVSGEALWEDDVEDTDGFYWKPKVVDAACSGVLPLIGTPTRLSVHYIKHFSTAHDCLFKIRGVFMFQNAREVQLATSNNSLVTISKFGANCLSSFPEALRAQLPVYSEQLPLKDLANGDEIELLVSKPKFYSALYLCRFLRFTGRISRFAGVPSHQVPALFALTFLPVLVRDLHVAFPRYFGIAFALYSLVTGSVFLVSRLFGHQVSECEKLVEIMGWKPARDQADRSSRYKIRFIMLIMAVLAVKIATLAYCRSLVWIFVDWSPCSLFPLYRAFHRKYERIKHHVRSIPLVRSGLDVVMLAVLVMCVNWVALAGMSGSELAATLAIQFAASCATLLLEFYSYYKGREYTEKQLRQTLRQISIAGLLLSFYKQKESISFLLPGT